MQACGDSCRLLIVAEDESDFSNPMDPKIDDCNQGPTQIDLTFDKPTKVLGYEYWDNDESSWQNTKLLWQLENTPPGCWAKFCQIPLIFLMNDFSLILTPSPLRILKPMGNLFEGVFRIRVRSFHGPLKS